jgi:hypothetical protein
MKPDIAAVRDVIIPELDTGKNVVVIIHSWGGLPVNSALYGFSKLEREMQSKSGAVLKIIYSNTFLGKRVKAWSALSELNLCGSLSM